MAQQNPRPSADIVAIRHAGADDCGIEHARAGKQRTKFAGARPVHRVYRIAVIRIAERHRDENEPATRQDFEAMARQPVRRGHMLQQVAAQQGPRAERAQAGQIGRIGQIGADIDPRRVAHVDMHDIDAAIAQRTKQQLLGPGLRLSRNAAELLPRLSNGDSRSGATRRAQCAASGLRLRTSCSRSHPRRTKDARSRRNAKERAHQPDRKAIANTRGAPRKCASRRDCASRPLSASAFPEATPLNAFLAWNEARHAKDRRYRIICDIHQMLRDLGAEVCLAHLAGQPLGLRRFGERIVAAPTAATLAQRFLAEAAGSTAVPAAQDVIASLQAAIGSLDLDRHAAVFRAFEELARHVDLNTVARLQPRRISPNIPSRRRRILIVKLGALGDFIQALGPVPAIRQHHAGDQIAC